MSRLREKPIVFLRLFFSCISLVACLLSASTIVQVRAVILYSQAESEEYLSVEGKEFSRQRLGQRQLSCRRHLSERLYQQSPSHHQQSPGWKTFHPDPVSFWLSPPLGLRAPPVSSIQVC